MIKVTVRYNDHLADIHFPCSETTLRATLMEIHVADDNPPELFVTDVIFPEELGFLKDRFVNLDELNYLAKRMESFFGNEEAVLIIISVDRLIFQPPFPLQTADTRSFLFALRIQTAVKRCGNLQWFYIK